MEVLLLEVKMLVAVWRDQQFLHASLSILSLKLPQQQPYVPAMPWAIGAPYPNLTISMQATNVPIGIHISQSNSTSHRV